MELLERASMHVFSVECITEKRVVVRHRWRTSNSAVADPIVWSCLLLFLCTLGRTKCKAIGRKAPHVSSAIFQNGDHVTMVPQPLAWSLGRHRDRNAALRVASTRRSRWTSTRTRWGRRARHTWRRTETHIAREKFTVVLEHVEVCAPRAFFWTAVCLLCDE